MTPANTHDTPNNDRHYVLVNGEKVFVSPEVWKYMTSCTNREHYRARRDGACAYAGFTACHGDCATCSHRVQGRTLSLDYEDFQKTFDAGPCAPAAHAPSPEEAFIAKERKETIYALAATALQGGDVLLRLQVEENLRLREIAEAVQLPLTTVAGRLKKVYQYLRDHREEFL